MKIEEIKELIQDIDSGKIKTLKQNSKFKFTCTMCGKCCFSRDVIINIYELVRMRNALKMTTSQLFQNKIITTFIGAESGLPLCMINMKNKACPLLAPIYFSEDIKTKQDLEKINNFNKPTNHYGCAINKHKPMMCRLYPVGRIIKIDKNNKMSSKFILSKEEVCKEAFDNGKEWTLKEWLDNIEFKHYKAGSANFTSLVKPLNDKGFNVSKKDGKLQENSNLLNILITIIFDFDSLEVFKNNKIVQSTITNKNTTHKEFMYVTNLVTEFIKNFVTLTSSDFKTSEKVATKFINESRTKH